MTPPCAKVAANMAKKKRDNGVVPTASADEPTLVETASVVSDPPPYMLEDLGTGVEPLGEIWPGPAPVMLDDVAMEGPPIDLTLVEEMMNSTTAITVETTTITLTGETVVAGEVVVAGEIVGGEVIGDEEVPSEPITIDKPNENVGVRVMRMLNQSLEAEVAALRAELDAARVVVADYEARLADVSEDRSRIDGRKAALAMENALLNDRIEELSEQRNDLLANLKRLSVGTLFQILPKHHETQPKVTRLLVIAADAPEAIRKVVEAGAVKSNDIANLTVVCDKVYL